MNVYLKTLDKFFRLFASKSEYLKHIKGFKIELPNFRCPWIVIKHKNGAENGNELLLGKLRTATEFTLVRNCGKRENICGMCVVANQWAMDGCFLATATTNTNTRTNHINKIFRVNIIIIYLFTYCYINWLHEQKKKAAVIIAAKKETSVVSSWRRNCWEPSYAESLADRSSLAYDLHNVFFASGCL